MKKKILSATLAMLMVFGSAALPSNAFTDTADITASAAVGDVTECEDVDIINDGASKGYRVSNFKLMTATSYVLQSVQDGQSCYAVGEKAFAGYKHNLSQIEIEQGCTKIEKDAFINSYNLKKYVIPYSVREIGEHAIGYEKDGSTYKKIAGVTIHCDPGSAAEKYAKDNSFKCEYFVKDPVRLAGKGRYETAAEISKYEFTKADTVVLANGMNYADALAGGVLAARRKAPLVLVGSSLDNMNAGFLDRHTFYNEFVFGGTGAVPDTVVNKVAAYRK